MTGWQDWLSDRQGLGEAAQKEILYCGKWCLISTDMIITCKKGVVVAYWAVGSSETGLAQYFKKKKKKKHAQQQPLRYSSCSWRLELLYGQQH